MYWHSILGSYFKLPIWVSTIVTFFPWSIKIMSCLTSHNTNNRGSITGFLFVFKNFHDSINIIDIFNINYSRSGTCYDSLGLVWYRSWAVIIVGKSWTIGPSTFLSLAKLKLQPNAQYYKKTLWFLIMVKYWIFLKWW